MRFSTVLFYDGMILKNPADILFLNTAGSVEVGLDLADDGPEVDLRAITLVTRATHSSTQWLYSRDPRAHP